MKKPNASRKFIRPRKLLKALVGKKLARKIPVNFVLYGVAAYVGLRLLQRSGILTKPTGAALDVIDRAWEAAKQRTVENPELQASH